MTGSLLDVGAGIGALTFELLERGVSRAIAVDASAAYVKAASEEAARRSRSGVIQFVNRDFLSVAGDIPSATIVTLDRVICCYPAWEPLLGEALRHTYRHFAFSYPRDVWYVRAGNALLNVGRRIMGYPFRTFVHPAAQMAEAIRRAWQPADKRTCGASRATYGRQLTANAICTLGVTAAEAVFRLRQGSGGPP